jgi:hypothetical protein
MGLNESFYHIRGQILLIDPLHSINKVFSLIIQKESQRQISIGSMTHHTAALMTKLALAQQNQFAPAQQNQHMLSRINLHLSNRTDMSSNAIERKS